MHGSGGWEILTEFYSAHLLTQCPLCRWTALPDGVFRNDGEFGGVCFGELSYWSGALLLDFCAGNKLLHKSASAFCGHVEQELHRWVRPAKQNAGLDVKLMELRLHWTGAGTNYCIHCFASLTGKIMTLLAQNVNTFENISCCNYFLWTTFPDICVDATFNHYK